MTAASTPRSHIMMEFPIIYQDDWLVAIHKPAGLLVHRNAHAPHEACVLQALRDQLGRHVFPVHRLDRPTSGLLLMALSTESARRMARQFADQTVDKTYVAVVRGFVPELGVIDAPLRAQSGAEQPARTEYARRGSMIVPVAMGRYPTQRYSVVRVHPTTGRTHQIRRHFAHIRHPLIGDVLRGDGRHNRLFREQFGLHRLLLASVELRCTHPQTGHPLTLRCPVADDMDELLARFDQHPRA